jgi:hypothetical protein
MTCSYFRNPLRNIFDTLILLTLLELEHHFYHCKVVINSITHNEFFSSITSANLIFESFEMQQKRKMSHYVNLRNFCFVVIFSKNLFALRVNNPFSFQFNFFKNKDYLMHQRLTPAQGIVEWRVRNLT